MTAELSQDEYVDQVLTTLALATGSLRETRQMLRDIGLVVTYADIRKARNENREFYDQRRRELAGRVEGRVAGDLLDNASTASKLIRRLLEETLQRLKEGKIEDPARTARDISQVMAQATDKRLAIQGRPTQIYEHRDVAEIIRALEGKGLVEIIEGTAVDSTPLLTKETHDRRDTDRAA